MTTASVQLWGTRIGALHWDQEKELGLFEYDANFRRSGIQLAPLHMPLSPTTYSFPALARDTFHGLPGMLADVIPDRFGNALINTWLASQGRTPESFNPVERLCYSGKRGMGALEFEPAMGLPEEAGDALDVAALVDLAGRILADRNALQTSFAEGKEQEAMRDILRVGTSAGGARAKAVIAWNRETGEVRSGSAAGAEGFSHWLIKFDGVRGNRDKELEDPMGYGRIEFAYSKMARAAGIEMEECQLMCEGERAHFVTRRFDRTDDGSKLHLQSLCALAHFDFNMAGAYSYEQAVQVMRQIGLPMDEVEQQFRRALFNVVARNQDDHVKNIAFLMNKRGQWSLSPAYDVTYSYNPEGSWTSRHQMSLNGKRDGFTHRDVIAAGKTMGLKRGRAESMLEEVLEAVQEWPTYAAQAEVPEVSMNAIHRRQRTELPKA